MNKKLALTTILIFCASWVFAQISITMPASRMVFQRNNSNLATIPIVGHFSKFADRIEARAVPMVAGQGQVTSWVTIQNNPQAGFYSGNLTVTGGWYDIEVRSLAGNNVVDATDIQRIGVGEVFLVAGQSNAQGRYGLNSPAVTDDRVNTVNYSNIGIDNVTIFPKPQFEKMTAEGKVGPMGNSAWCWGALGEQLVARLNVPVMFYNAAYEGTSVRVWQESINGTALSDYPTPSGGLGYYAPKIPYGNLRLALRDYVATSGVRAILWHQGETDNTFNTTTNDYVNRLKAVINQTRTDTGKTIPWVVSKASYKKPEGVDAAIIAGQTQVIASTPLTFEGPSTDVIDIPRNDQNVHFSNIKVAGIGGTGITDLANAWNTMLNSAFFNSATPIQSIYPNITGTCNGNQLAVNVSGNNLSQITWNFGTTGLNAGLNPGQYQGVITDNLGNVFYMPTITVPTGLQPATPSITVDGRIPMCLGNSIGLIAPSSGNFVWNTGSTAQRIDVNTAGVYTLSAKNQYSCSASASVNVTTLSTPLPVAPAISASGPTSFCSGGSVQLVATNGTGYLWSNGQTNNAITVKDGGTYQVRSVDSQGCTSSPTSINVTVNSLPNPPTIAPQSATTFCSGGQVKLTSSAAAGNFWSTGEQAKEITVSSAGNYNVRVKDANGCEAVSSNIAITVNPLPAAPTVTNDRPTTFCSGDSTVLTSTTAPAYRWSSNELSRRIVVKNTGAYSLSVTDANGCTSAKSNTVNVTVNSLPPAPTISTNRTPSICENEYITFSSTFSNSYLWSNGQQTQTFTTNFGGTYSVRGIDTNGCMSAPSSPITLSVTTLPKRPIVTLSGPATFCQGGSLTMKVTNYTTGLRWSTTESGTQITANTPGIYRVTYKDAIGCESFPSDFVTVVVNPLPVAPTITNERPTTFCQGDFSTLFAPVTDVTYNWSNGATTQRISPSQGGDYSLTVTSLATGCTSPMSAATKVTVNPLPAQPTITAAGATVICGDQSVTLNSSDAVGGYEWSNGSTTKTVSVNQEGNYTVKAKNQFGCLSVASAPVLVKVNPLPATPSIVAEGNTTFCEGNQVALRVDTPLEVFWNTNEIARRIVAKQTGNYSARVRDANGCYSAYSTVMRVDVKTAPNAPVIEQVGMYTLAVQGATTTNNFEWKYNGTALTGDAPAIKASKAGEYQVSTFVKYSSTLTCYSKPSATFAYVPDLSTGGIGIYPNPSNGNVTIETLENLRDVTITIYDDHGRFIKSMFVNVFDERKRFDLTNLAPATYYLKFTATGFQIIRKMIIMK